MQKWEYKHLKLHEAFPAGAESSTPPEQRVVRLNALGAEGWELVTMTSYEGSPWELIFKRPK